MQKEIEIQKALFSTINQPDKVFFNMLGNMEEETTEYLNRYQLLEHKMREQLTWQLQIYIESAMKNYEDLEGLTQQVLERWNSEQSIPLHDEAVKAFIVQLFPSSNMRKAFIALCEGDVKAYKGYALNSDLFVDYLIRSIFAFQEKSNAKVIKNIARRCYQTYFEDDERRQVNNALRRLGIIRYSPSKQRKEIILWRGRNYGILSKKLKAPFLKGYKKIFREILMKDPSILNDSNLSPFFQQFATKEIVMKHVRTEESLKKKAQINENKLDEGSDIIEHIDRIIEDLTRTKYSIQEEQRNTDGKLLIDLLKELGGPKGSYVLSSLYQESVGETDESEEGIQKQLILFFRILSTTIGLEAYSMGYRIGEVFTMTGEQLARMNILHNEPLQKELKVKLKHYGWKLKDEIVVQPLVEVIK